MTVAIGNLSCGDVTVTQPVTLSEFTCLAPAGPGLGNVSLHVTVNGSGTAHSPFLYDPPQVLGVQGSPCDAEAVCLLRVTGTNLGLKNSQTSPEPLVYVGDQLCQQPLLSNSSWLQCTVGPSVVGRTRVVVSLNNQNSTQAVNVDRLCGDDRFGLPGEPCSACPSSAQCVGLFPVPLPLPGFYPVSLTEFLACVPTTACAGVDVAEVRAMLAASQSSADASRVLERVLTQFLELRVGASGNSTVCLCVHCACAATRLGGPPLPRGLFGSPSHPLPHNGAACVLASHFALSRAQL